MVKVLSILLVFISQIAFSQSALKIGPYSNMGVSSYYGSNTSVMNTNETDMPVYSLKLTSGIGLKVQYSISEKWGIQLLTSYQQRGAMFDKGKYNYTPAYKFNYLDFALGITYHTKELIKTSRLFFSIAGSYNYLLNSARKNNFETYNLINDSQRTDFGINTNVGISIPRVEKDLIQLSLFTNVGFQNVFGGVLKENGQIGKNVLFGIQLGYLFGCDKKQKKNDLRVSFNY